MAKTTEEQLKRRKIGDLVEIILSKDSWLYRDIMSPGHVMSYYVDDRVCLVYIEELIANVEEIKIKGVIVGEFVAVLRNLQKK